MTDDVRRLLHEAVAPTSPGPAASTAPRSADFATMWRRGRRRRGLVRAGGAAGGALAVAGVALVVPLVVSAPSHPGVAGRVDGCPVTIPDGDFAPPAPHDAASPIGEGQAWFGSAELWTSLPLDGTYLPRKSVWWSEDFAGGGEESTPDLRVTWTRLDDPDPDPDAAPIVVDGGTNAHTPEQGWLMIAGLDPTEPGCWQVTATYRDAELSYVFEVNDEVAPVGS